jgi:beta-lactamase regulating signal transducer with metallopeptidase domain
MIFIYETLHEPARTLVEALLNGSWHGMLLTLAVAMVLPVLPRTSAATRYVVWCVTLLAVALLPLAAFVGDRAPSTHTAVAPSGAWSPPAAASGNAWNQPPHGAHTGDAARSRSGSTPRTWTIKTASGAWWSLAAGVWLFVVIARLSRIVWGVREVRHLKRSSRTLPLPYRSSLQNWSREIRARRTVEIRVSDVISTPVTVGYLHPAILIPTRLLQALTSEELAQVTLHEMAHARRYDDWTNLAQRVIEALLFFHPAAHWIARRLDLERELACDDQVVAIVAGVRSYASCLTRLAELARESRPLRLAPGAAPTGSHLAARVRALLSAGPRFTGTSTGACAAATVLVAVSAGLLTRAAPMISLSEVIPPLIPAAIANQPALGFAALKPAGTREAEEVRRAVPAAPTATPGAAAQPVKIVLDRTSSGVPPVQDFTSPVPHVVTAAEQTITARDCRTERISAELAKCRDTAGEATIVPMLALETQPLADTKRAQAINASPTAYSAKGASLTVTLRLPDHASIDHPGTVVAGLSAFGSAATRYGAGPPPNVGNRSIRDGEVPVRGGGIRLRVIGGDSGRGSSGRALPY